MGVNFIYYRLSQPGNNTDVYATTDAQLNLDRIHCSDIDIFFASIRLVIQKFDLYNILESRIWDSFTENNLLKIEDFAFDNYYKCKAEIPRTILCTVGI